MLEYLLLQFEDADSDGVLEGKSNLKNLCIKGLYLFLELIQLLVFLLPAGGIIVLTVVGQLVYLERVVEVLRESPLLLEALDIAGAYLEAFVGDAGRRCCCCLHVCLGGYRNCYFK